MGNNTDSTTLNSEERRRYHFLLGFLIEHGVLTDKRYHNDTWCLRGVYGVDDSGLRGAGRSAEEAIDNAITASTLDPEAAHRFWQTTHAALTPPAPAAVTEGASEQLYRRVVTYEGFGVTGVVFEPVATPHPAVAVPGSLTAEQVAGLLSQFEVATVRCAQMHREYLGKAMSDQTYNAFATLRDDTIPALRKRLIAALATTSTAAPPESGVKP